MDRGQVKQLLLFLGGALPKVRIPGESLDSWAITLASDDYDGIAAAAAEWVREQSTLPAPADLRRIARERQAPTLAALPPPAAYTDEERAKARMHLANIRAFLAGERKASDMVLESYRIYATERPFPSAKDAEGVEACTEAALEKLQNRPGPLFRHLRKTGGVA